MFLNKLYKILPFCKSIYLSVCLSVYLSVYIVSALGLWVDTFIIWHRHWHILISINSCTATTSNNGLMAVYVCGVIHHQPFLGYHAKPATCWIPTGLNLWDLPLRLVRQQLSKWISGDTIFFKSITVEDIVIFMIRSEIWLGKSQILIWNRLKADTHEGFCSRSMLPEQNPSCVPMISWVQFILGSRISTLQHAPQY